MLDISEVARETGLAASTLRYYEEIGLIQSAGRKGLRRQYQPQVLMQLALIRLARRAGFSLAELLEMFKRMDLKQKAGLLPALDRPLLLDKANSLDQKIQELRVMRDGLRHAAACPAPNHLECPTFQRLLRAGGQQQRPARSASDPHR